MPRRNTIAVPTPASINYEDFLAMKARMAPAASGSMATLDTPTSAELGRICTDDLLWVHFPDGSATLVHRGSTCQFHFTVDDIETIRGQYITHGQWIRR
jgi:hypothetical protein